MWGLLIQAGISLGALGVNWLYKKLHERPFQRPRPDDLDFIQTEVGAPIPVVYGRARVDNAVCAWVLNREFTQTGPVTLGPSSPSPLLPDGTFVYGADVCFLVGVPAWDESGEPWSDWRTENPPRLLSLFIGDQQIGPFGGGGVTHGEKIQFGHDFGDGNKIIGFIEFWDGRVDQEMTAPGTLARAAYDFAGIAVDSPASIVPEYRNIMAVVISTSGAGTFGTDPRFPSIGFEVECLGPQPVGA
ncbi:MAG: hypothetical protein AB7T06_39580 [Kofleriaceae bacterium]